ncbi:hypothetical protein BC835DRAFT_1421766 [Cytidiella melzeri]|nr:hypothetical protein BC835DRAFT_1421766 [Cytidiella melzeri]
MPSPSSSHLKPDPPRESWMAYDSLIAKAFAAHQTPAMTETASSAQTLRAVDPNVHSPRSPSDILSPDQELEPVWDAVRQFKAKALAALPSKVKSLEGVDTGVETQVPKAIDQKKLKRKSSAILRESPDGRMSTALFDMAGVSKQDMHVSFRSNRIVVTWRRVKVVESIEDGVRVRERKERQYSQMIPLPEGTQFSEIKAARNGEYLMLTFPNLRCVKVDAADASTTAWSSGETDFMTCEAGTMLDFEDLTVEKADSPLCSARKT